MKNKTYNIGKDIINIKFSKKKTLEQLIKEFYVICEKHKIKIHTKTKNGMVGHNFDYTMAKSLFLKRLESSFDFMEWGLTTDNVPSVTPPKNVNV